MRHLAQRLCHLRVSEAFGPAVVSLEGVAVLTKLSHTTQASHLLQTCS